MDARFRLWSGLLLVAYVAFLAFVLFQSEPALASRVVGRTAEFLDLAGAPAAATAGARVEFALNALMFVPVALLAALTFPRHPWANWVVYGFVGSGLVELVQGLWLPLRSAQYVDVVANTGGMLAGALVSLLVRRGLRRSSGRPASHFSGE